MKYLKLLTGYLAGLGFLCVIVFSIYLRLSNPFLSSFGFVFIYPWHILGLWTGVFVSLGLYLWSESVYPFR